MQSKKEDLYLGPSAGVAVDASCRDMKGKGSTGKDYFRGRVEWRVVDLATDEEIYRSRVFHQSTINIGEFCAIVDGLRILHERGDEYSPVYSDSKLTIYWVKNKYTSTSLPRNQHTADALYELDHSLIWLKKNKPRNPVIWWSARELGPMPADFGRK